MLTFGYVEGNGNENIERWCVNNVYDPSKQTAMNNRADNARRVQHELFQAQNDLCSSSVSYFLPSILSEYEIFKIEA